MPDAACLARLKGKLPPGQVTGASTEGMEQHARPVQLSPRRPDSPVFAKLRDELGLGHTLREQRLERVAQQHRTDQGIEIPRLPQNTGHMIHTQASDPLPRASHDVRLEPNDPVSPIQDLPLQLNPHYFTHHPDPGKRQRPQTIMSSTEASSQPARFSDIPRVSLGQLAADLCPHAGGRRTRGGGSVSKSAPTISDTGSPAGTTGVQVTCGNEHGLVFDVEGMSRRQMDAHCRIGGAAAAAEPG